MRHAAVTLTALLAVAAAAGCSSGNMPAAGDKAGGSTTPLVLRLGFVNWVDNGADLHLLQDFAERVAKRSGDRLRVRLVSEDYTAPDEELAVARRVRAGRLDLGWISTRGWDDLGAESVRALDTPFLITSNRLMDAIASSPLAEGLLRGVDRYGVVGLALVPRALMHPAALRPLRGPGDYAGTQFLVARSRTTGDLLAAYGAKAVFTVKAVTSKGPPGAIFPLTDDGTDVQTGNVTLYPRFGTLFANSGVFDRLSHDQRAALLAAAKDMVDEAITQTPSEEAAARVHCQTGRVVLASPSELGALRRAAQPVLAKLERDLQTRAAIAAIRSLAARTPPDPPLVVPQRCRA